LKKSTNFRSAVAFGTAKIVAIDVEHITGKEAIEYANAKK